MRKVISRSREARKGWPSFGPSMAVPGGGMEHLLRQFFDTWKGGIEAINRDVIKSFANFHLGQELLKQVLTQLLLYYTRFLDLVKATYPNGAPFAKFILSIPTLMGEIRNFSRSF